MEFEPSTTVWKSRGGADSAVGTSVVNSKDGTKLVLVTTQNEVVEYCTQTRKCVNHWTFRPGSNAALRIAAVRNPISQAYFGVRSTKKAQGSKSPQGETLVAWKQSDLDVSKWKRATLTETASVYGLFVHPQLPDEVVVVFENGRFEGYDDALHQSFDSSAQNEEPTTPDVDGKKVVWASLASSHRNPAKGALLLSMLVQVSVEVSQYELVVLRVLPTKERRYAQVGATQVVRYTLPMSTAASVVSCAFHAETLSYSVILSSGEWHMVYFRHDALTNAIAFASTKKITTFASDVGDNATPIHKKRKLSNASANASSQFVAGSVGPFSYLVVASAASPLKLIGWDSKFGVQVVSTEVKTDKDSEAVPLPSHVGQLRSLISTLHGETVVAAYDHAVFLLNVKNKHSTLASVLGVYTGAKEPASASAPALPNSNVNWADIASSKVELSEWQQAVCSDDTIEQQLLAELVDTTTRVTAASFQKKFDAAVHKLGGKDVLSYRFLMAVARRCIDAAENVALWGPLKSLIQSKRLSSRALPSLLPVLMKHNQYELLELALLHLADIDERSIVRLLRFFIHQSDDDQLRQYVDSKHKPAKPAVGKRKKTDPAMENQDAAKPTERFLVALLALPTNAVFLHHAIRELHLSDVLLLLAICKKYFYAHTDKRTTPRPTTLVAPLPSAAQFCAWICALIDGHVAQLVLTASKDAKTAASLEQLDALVQAQLASCESFEGVHSVLGNFLSGVKLPRAHGIPDYSIEELVIA